MAPMQWPGTAAVLEKAELEENVLAVRRGRARYPDVISPATPATS